MRRKQVWKAVAKVDRSLSKDTIDKIGEIIMEDLCKKYPVDIHTIVREESVTFEVGKYTESQM